MASDATLLLTFICATDCVRTSALLPSAYIKPCNGYTEQPGRQFSSLPAKARYPEGDPECCLCLEGDAIAPTHTRQHAASHATLPERACCHTMLHGYGGLRDVLKSAQGLSMSMPRGEQQLRLVLPSTAVHARLGRLAC